MADDNPDLGGDLLLDEGSLFLLAPEDGGSIAGHVPDEIQRFLAVESEPGARQICG